MTNRFERGYVPPQPLEQRLSGGVEVVAATAKKAEADLLPLAGALYNVSTTENTVADPAWATTSTFFITPSGQQLSRTTYSQLFARISGVWGYGDGFSTFNSVNVNRFGVTAPFTVSVAPTTYTTVGTYGSGNFVEHSHLITNANQVTWNYNGDGGDQRGNYPAAPQTALSGTLVGSPTVQTPKGATCRCFLAYIDSTDSLPLGTLVAHLTPISSIATVLAENPKLLVASGQTIDAGIYTNYVAAYGAALPDFQGRFLRQDIAGLNTPAPATTTTINTSFAVHGHRWTGGTLRAQGTYVQSPNVRNFAGSVSGAYYNPTPSRPYSLGPGNETRPYNTSVTYLIKVKP
jgi:hypothetical protein